MNKNKVLLLAVPAFLLLFFTFQNFEDSRGPDEKIDFDSLVDESSEEMAEAKQTAQERRTYYRQLRKNEALQNQIQPKMFIDDGQQSAALEEQVKAISEKSKTLERETSSLPDASATIEHELIQADK